MRPATGSGIMAEVIATSTKLTIPMSLCRSS